MATNDSNGWPSFRALLMICFAGMLLAQPMVRKRQRDANASGADFGETVATYMVERDRKTDKQAKVMLIMTAVSCFAAVLAAVVAAVLAIGL